VNVACQSQGAKQVIFGTMHPRGYHVCLHRSLDSGGRIIHLAVGESKNSDTSSSRSKTSLVIHTYSSLDHLKKNIEDRISDRVETGCH